MIVPESWLRSFCDPPLATQELTQLLTMSGLEVEACTDICVAGRRIMRFVTPARR